MGNGKRRRTLLALGLTAAVVLALNLAGVLRYPGGPLREAHVQEVLWLDLRLAAAARNEVTALSDAGIRIDDRVLAAIFLPADVALATTVERVELVGATPGLELVNAWIARAGVDGPRPGLIPADAATLAEIKRTYRLLPAELAPGGTADDGVIVIELRASAAGSFEYPAVAVDYRIGPFTFQALHGRACACASVHSRTGRFATGTRRKQRSSRPRPLATARALLRVMQRRTKGRFGVVRSLRISRG